MTLTLSPEAFLQLTSMVAAASAAFGESWEGRARDQFQENMKEYTQ
ncbi:MAG: hypothetical protein L0219_09670 [Phycisphaerales bacterium]|nr:hypothetical protein [Phycisphaerales bacterium]